MRWRLPGSEAWRAPLGRLSRLATTPAWAGPLRLVRQRRAGAAPSPLALALLTAIALHLLVLAAHQLRQRHQPAAVIPPPRDDTPELLQFSRQQTREPALAPLSIAALAQLPPPPPPPLTPSTTGPGAALRPDAPRRSADQRRTTSTPGRAPGPKTASDRSGRRNQTSGRPAASSGRQDPGLEGALASLARWQSGADGRASAGEAGWPTPQKPDAEQAALWMLVWERATPGGTATGQPRRLPAGVELRRLTGSDSEAEALPPERKLSLALADRVLLIWSTDGEVWLLQAPASRPEIDGDRQENG